MAKAVTGIKDRIRSAMQLAGLNQSELAKRLDISQAAVSGWIKGIKMPTTDNIKAMSGVLNTTPQWLQYGEGPGPGPDLEAARTEYRETIDWGFRPAPEDRGRDYGNANVWAFDPTIWVMVRDILQNCRDAMRPGSPAVEVVFKVIRLKGTALDEFKAAVAWDRLLPHLKASAEIDQRLGRLIKHNLEKLEREKELVLLVVEDRGTIGLIGGEDGTGNFAALVRNNLDSNKLSGTAGGAFGLGKAVLWRMSAFSLVLFGSNLSESAEVGLQFRRVMGRCDLPWHECPEAGVESEPFAGPGWFGRKDGERTVSVWNNEAVMHDLHLSRAEDIGTSCAIVGFHDPSSDTDLAPQDMVKEIKRAVADCFWPDLTLGRLKVRVEHYEGREQKSSTEVAPEEFCPEFVDLLNRWRNDEDTVESLKRPGEVAIAAIPLEYPERREDPTHPAGVHQAVLLVRASGDEPGRDARANTLAVFRGVGMVVKYHELQASVGAMPFHAALLCGEAAVRPGTDPDPTSRSADRFLRTAEPPNHDEWKSTPDLGTEYARGGKSAIDKFIFAAKAKVRELVRPPTDDLDDGPNAIKELLNIGDEDDDSPGAPYVYRPTGTPSDDGSWSVQAKIKVKRGELAWLVEPVITFQKETGAGEKVKWKKLTAVKNCEVKEGQRLLIQPNVTEAAFEGQSDPDTHLIDAHESSIMVELRKCEPQKEENS